MRDPVRPLESASARIGAAVRKTRLRRHLTQQQLADAIGVTKADLSRIESGHSQRGPSAERLEALARALGVLPSTLAASLDSSTIDR